MFCFVDTSSQCVIQAGLELMLCHPGSLWSCHLHLPVAPECQHERACATPSSILLPFPECEPQLSLYISSAPGGHSTETKLCLPLPRLEQFLLIFSFVIFCFSETNSHRLLGKPGSPFVSSGECSDFHLPPLSFPTLTPPPVSLLSLPFFSLFLVLFLCFVLSSFLKAPSQPGLATEYHIQHEYEPSAPACFIQMYQHILWLVLV